MDLSQRFKILFFSSLVFLGVSCGRETINQAPSVSPQGGQDSGGGGTFGSTYGQVEYYFKDEKELKRSLTEILYNLLSDHGREYDWLGNYKLKNYANENLFLIENNNLAEKILDRLNNIVSREDTKNEPELTNTNEKLPQVDFCAGQWHPASEGLLCGYDEPDPCEKLSRKECKKLQEKERLQIQKNKKEYDFAEKIEKEKERKAYIKEYNINPRTETGIDYSKLFPFNQNPAAAYTDSRFSYLERYISKIKIKLNYDDSCLDKYKNKKVASVENFTENSSICISIKQLAKTPPESLQKQIHALLIHEVMHTLGFYEDDAVLLQKFVLENYDDYLRYGNINYTVKKTLFSRANELKTSIDLVLITYRPSDFIYQKTYGNSKFHKSFESLWLQAEDIRYLINGYLADLEKKDLNQKRKLKIRRGLDKLDKVLEELGSLYILFEKIQFYNRIGEPQFSEGAMYRYNKPESYSFIYYRLQYLSDKLNSIGVDLNKTSVLNEGEPGVLPAK